MSRTAFGIALLAVLLAGGIASAVGLTGHNSAISAQLNAAADQAMAGDLSGAMDTAQVAQEDWEKGWKISAAFTDHNPLEQINIGFDRLHLHGEARDPVAYALVCRELAGQIEALGDAHGTQWWNIL